MESTPSTFTNNFKPVWKKGDLHTSAAEMVLFPEAEVKEKFHRKQKN